MHRKWSIAQNEYIRTGSCHIAGPHGIEEWPNKISSKWKFVRGGKWQEAENDDIVFKDCSPKGDYTSL